MAARTPLVASPAYSAPTQLFHKLESMQPIGSFKLRGAYNKIATLTAEERKRGVIAHSSGNHAQGVAYAARAMGIKATIVLPSSAPKIKVDATKALGAEIVTVGPISTERVEMADKLAAQHGYVLVPPYNDEMIIAGQGTIGLEIFEDLEDVKLVLVPVSGGGLISGVAAALKARKPNIKIVGVEPELAADAQASLKAGKIIKFDPEKVTKTIADGLRTTPVGAIPFEYIYKYVDDIVTVTEDEIRAAVKRLLLESRFLAEPSGAVTSAAFFYHHDQLPPAKKTVAVVSGGNIAPEMLREIMA
ncbi:MAG: Pyridoxal-5-phosphate-dependent enzyme beta subunit [Acidobacteriales bacterium]|nr:Pyridoxal-5-phosphate-dependent enzyme beta subunit [Terriglobales bacterium]